MLKRFDKELSEVVSQFEIARRSAVSALTFVAKDEQAAELHYVTFLKDMKALNEKVTDLKRHMSEAT